LQCTKLHDIMGLCLALCYRRNSRAAFMWKGMASN